MAYKYTDRRMLFLHVLDEFSDAITAYGDNPDQEDYLHEFEKCQRILYTHLRNHLRWNNVPIPEKLNQIADIVNNLPETLDETGNMS